MAEPFDLVIAGGTVVTAERTVRCDVGIRHGLIAAVGHSLIPAKDVLDASGRFVLPGGVDAHCHIEQVSSTGLVTADDFHSGGISAACGGTTTIIPFAAQHRGLSLTQVVRDYECTAAPKAFVDYAFHLIVSDPTPVVLSRSASWRVSSGQLPGNSEASGTCAGAGSTDKAVSSAWYHDASAAAYRSARAENTEESTGHKYNSFRIGFGRKNLPDALARLEGHLRGSR